MTFSVIVPAYNAEKSLAICLESVRNQTYSDFEVVVVNDGSTDHTAQIIDEFCDKDKRFKAIHQKNQGVSASRNKGIEMACGEYLVFLDSDDYYEIGYLRAFREMIEAYPEYDHYWCSFSWITPQTKDIDGNTYQNNRADICVLNRSEIMTLHERVLDAALWNKAYKRSIIQKHGIRMRENLSLGEDLLFNYQYLDVTKSEILLNQLPMYAYTSAVDGTLNSKYRDDLEQIYDLLDEEMLRYLLKWNVEQAQMTKYYNSVFYGMERVLFNTFHMENKKNYFEKLKTNTRILFSKKFREALTNSNCFIHPLFRIGYMIGCWPFIQMMHRLAQAKRTR